MEDRRMQRNRIRRFQGGTCPCHGAKRLRKWIVRQLNVADAIAGTDTLHFCPPTANDILSDSDRGTGWFIGEACEFRRIPYREANVGAFCADELRRVAALLWEAANKLDGEPAEGGAA